MKTEYLLHQQVSHVLAALTPQNQLIARVCLHTGLRVGDVVGLHTADIKQQFMVTENKTGKRRKVGLPEHLRKQILEQAGSEWAFPGRDGGHKTRQAVWKDVKRAAKAFRIPQNVGPHSFRKVYAVQLRERYGSLSRVQRALNHGDMSVTMIYAMADQLLQEKLRRSKALKQKRQHSA